MTNVASPLINWTTNPAGVFGLGGAFANAMPLSRNPARFSRIKTL